MNHSLIKIDTENFLSNIENHQPCRVTQPLKNGNLAILQIVDPEDVTQFTKALRMLPGKIGKFLKSMEAAIRVGKIVYLNSMRKRKQ